MQKNKTIYIAANWKMNPSSFGAAEKLAENTASGIGDSSKKVTVILCPPFPYLQSAREQNENNSFYLGAQDCSFYEDGAHTGEVSAKMLREAGCDYVIIGHSERRAMGDTEEAVNKKVLSALQFGLKPIIAVGYTKNKGEYISAFLSRQVQSALKGVAEAKARRVIIAYEPIGSIGTGQVANADDILSARIFIQKSVLKLYEDTAIRTPILYGGSINSSNAVSILQESSMDGLLVGGASVRDGARDFVEIYNNIRMSLV